MGCGGSKADAIEPRYYESWTRETESTWLTNTDTETPLPGVISNNHGAPESAVPSMKDSATMYAGKGDEGRPAQGYVSVSSSSAHKEKKTVNTSTQCGKQPLYPTPGTDSQRRAAFHREEIKWESKKRSSKDVAVNVARGIQRTSKGEVPKSCVK
ncbi:brain and acute leukemia cytoplasmic protein [Lepisosteus oculatus]|uniref:BAALC binder of MAP3K1 and KLF4 a n=1 Tax=Lepisosteus oculatus TaxID=7918 RepID=W5MUV8_LEPOC|nr:PREDICTED: brain and acute leukemia cytoplasmic protein [Lepisosteus oculatus]